MLRIDSSEPLLIGIRGSGLIRPDDRVLVAVSGGPDSTALLVAAHEAGFNVVAAHYDHALQSGSELVAADVGALCERLGVDLLTERRVGPMPRGSIQAGARALRYEFLGSAQSLARADVVAIAHTADDLVEGVVLHLMRGCGLAGLRGMPSRRGPYVRPLLSVWRREVTDFLSRRSVAAHEDPSNRDMSYARVRVRLHILPALERDRPGISELFYAVAHRASVDHDSLSSQATSELSLGAPTRSGVLRMSEPLAAEVIKLLYARAGGSQPSLSRAHVASMLRLAGPGRGGRGVDLPGGLRFRIVGDHMEIIGSGTRTRLADGAGARLVVRQCSGCSDPEATHLHTGLDLRLAYRRPGLRMRPSGGRGSRKLQDIFVDAHLPREERDRWPLVFAGERLAWVPGIAVDSDLLSPPGRPAQHVAITPTPVRSVANVVSLETPNRPPGVPT